MKRLPQAFLLLVLSALSCLFLERAWVPQAEAGTASSRATLAPGDAEGGAPAPLDCSTPRRAVSSLLYYTQAPHVDLTQAVRCFDRRGRSPGELQRLARQVRSTLERRALPIDPADFSDEPGWVSQATREAVVELHRDLPGVRLERDDSGRWLWTRSSLDQIAYLSEARTPIPESVLALIPDSLRVDVFGVEGWQILALLLVFVAGLIVRKTIQFLLRRRFAPLAQQLGAESVGRIVDVFAGPGSTLVVAAMLAAFYPQLGLPFGASAALEIVVRALVVGSLVLSVYRLVDVAADRLAAKAASTASKLDDQLVPLLRRALKVVVVIAGVLFLLQNLNVNVGSLLAGLGIGGVAVALAAKDTVANFFGSIMIFVDRPFQIGDWVKIGDTEGIVEEVGFRSTRVRTFYNSRVTIPNAHFTEAAIDNMGLREYRRTVTTLGLTYDTNPEQMQAFVEGIRSIILANEYTRKDYYEIHFAGFGAHSLDVMVYIFFKVDSWTAELRERHNVYMEILRLAHEIGVAFALPTQTIHIDHVAPVDTESRMSTPKEPAEMARIVRAFGPDGELSRPRGPGLTEGHLAGQAGATRGS